MMFSSESHADALHWYVVKVYYHRYAALCATFERNGWEYFIPPYSPDTMLLFIKTSESYILSLQSSLCGMGMVCPVPGTHLPARISDDEMQMFRFVTEVAGDDMEIITRVASLRLRDYYRVTAGPWKGVEGFLARIRHRMRLVVTLGTLFTVAATTYIPKEHLLRIDLPEWKKVAE